MKWDGVTKAETIRENAARQRHDIAYAAKRYDWARLLSLIAEMPRFVNSTRPDGSSWYAPLHQVAHGGASIEVAQRLIEVGAWRTLPTAHGERPVDIATRHGQIHLVKVLTPVYKTQVPADTMAAIQGYFHQMIMGRAAELVRKHALRLPELIPMLELETPSMEFAVPGMYGGFYYELEATGTDTWLRCDSWSRVVMGSGERHVITAEGCTLVEKGFV